MIMVGKVIVSIIWAFWMMAMSTAEGNPAEDMSFVELMMNFLASHKKYGVLKMVVSGKVLM